MPSPQFAATEVPSTLQASGEARWLASTPLMDLRDSKLRLRVQSLTQLWRTPREQAVAIYGFVKTLPLMMAPAYRVMTARDCLEARRAGWYGKSTLLIALLRATGLPARLRVLGLSGEVLRGLVKTHLPFYLPVVEVWLDDRWVRTDTHILDPRSMSAARKALMENGWMRGFGVHRLGESLWNGREDAFAAVALDRHHSGMPFEDFGVFDDIAGFVQWMRRHQPQKWAMGMAHYRIMRPRLRRGLEAMHGGPDRSVTVGRHH